MRHAFQISSYLSKLLRGVSYGMREAVPVEFESEFERYAIVHKTFGALHELNRLPCRSTKMVEMGRGPTGDLEWHNSTTMK
jgi:hypothetical protein